MTQPMHRSALARIFWAVLEPGMGHYAKKYKWAFFIGAALFSTIYISQKWEGETVPGQTSQGCDSEISPSYWRMTMDKKNEIIIFWSSEDNAYVAEVPELAGCMADGKTYQEALGNAEQIIEEWIETATKLGRPIPQPRGRLAYA